MTRCTVAVALLVTFFVTHAGYAVSFRENGPFDVEYGKQIAIPRDFGAGEFTLELRIKLDASFPVGPVGPQNAPRQRVNWSEADPAPYSSGDWWYTGNFLLDGHNNNDFKTGTFSIQFCGGGRVRWLFGDGVEAGPGGHWAVQAHPSDSTPSLLDGAWHHVALVRRWGADPAGADLELWVDGKLIATEQTSARTDMRQIFETWPGFVPGEEGWFWGAEKQWANGTLDQYEDFKGELAELRFWSSARPKEVLETPEENVAQDAPGLVGLYGFPEAFGAPVCNAIGGGECIEFYDVDRGWSPLRADHAGVDWAAIVLFVWAAIMCVFGILRQRGTVPGTGVWRGILVTMLLLAAYVWLDIDLLSEQLSKELAREQGWYSTRRIAQGAVLIAMAAAAFFAGRAIARRIGQLHFSAQIAVGVAIVLVMIAGMRTVSLHFTDTLLNFGPAEMPLGRALEMAGACTISVCTLFARPAGSASKQG